MDIKILDSWLRDYLKTEASPDEIAKALSLTSASIEKIEPLQNDYIYSIEVTTNRPDMASVIGLAREAAAVLPRFEIEAEFKEIQPKTPHTPEENKQHIDIENDDSLVRRICAVIMDVQVQDSPDFIKNRLEASGTRSLNNLIDITNYVMHEVGHPTHVFDFDRLTTRRMIIRPSQQGEQIVTLDNKTHVLHGGDIVADNGKGEIIDLLGVMGTRNSVVTGDTKRILFFIDNNDPRRIRRTSMSLAIRTEAAGLNEKDVDPQLAKLSLLRGIELYQKYANGQIVSDIIDIYPKKSSAKKITVSKDKICNIVGIDIPVKQSIAFLVSLGFQVTETPETLEVTVPSWREKDMNIAEDVVEEIARIFGYHNIPSELPAFTIARPYRLENNIFYWENRAKEALKYWGFTETYTYSLVSKSQLTEPESQSVSLENPLDEDHIYLRQSLLPSLNEVIAENKGRENIELFEIANIYKKKAQSLPQETLMLAMVVKGQGKNFYSLKGILEQLAADFGIHSLRFTESTDQTIGAFVYIRNEYLGTVQQIDQSRIQLEINFSLLTRYATTRKVYTPPAKFPPIYEDLAFIIDKKHLTGDVLEKIRKQSPLIKSASLLDQYENTRTFHITYQHPENTMTNDDVLIIRNEIIKALSVTFGAKLKE